MFASHSYYHVLAVIIFAVFSYALTNIHHEEPVNSTAAERTVPLNLVVPGSTDLTVGHARQRIAANTSPDARAFINGKEVKVFPNGAFVGMVDIPAGKSTANIRVVARDGKSESKTIQFERPEPIKTTASSPVSIDREMRKPNISMELGEGEIIEVQFKGSPGLEATFSIDGIVENEPMTEKTRSETGGIGGIYSSSYKVRADDFATDVPVTYKLRESRRNTVTAESDITLSITPNAFPRVAEVQGRRAHLNVGTGTDRLGGARLGYLEQGVRVEVIGREGGQYRVRLTEQFEGYLPVRFAELLPESTPLPRSLTGSVSVRGSDDFDMVTLSLSQRLPYISTKKTRPNSIEIDIFGADSNTNWITHEQSAQGIKSVDWKQVGTHHYRLIIHLEHEVHWGYHVGYGIGNSLQIQVQRPPQIASPDRALEGMSIAVDVGHGGSNRGALGATGAEEKDVVLEIAKKVRNQLESEGARVLMTRDRDIALSMVERSEMIIASDAGVLLSIHANSIGATTNPMAIHGTSSYYRHDAFQPFAHTIHRHMLELPLRDFGLIGSFNFTLNALTELPNVLVETGFISHPEEEMKLLDPDFQEKMAEKIVSGVKDYYRKYGELAVAPDYAPETAAR